MQEEYVSLLNRAQELLQVSGLDVGSGLVEILKRLGGRSACAV